MWNLLLATMGCKEYSVEKGVNSAATFSDANPPLSEVSSNTDADSGLAIPEAAYYALDLDFTLESEGWNAASLVVYLYDPALEEVCSQQLPILGVTPEELPPEEPLLTWWKLELDVGIPSGPCPDWPARAWRLGLGSYDPALDPAMAASDMLGYDVYGLYLQEATGAPIYLVGVGGPLESLAGTPGLVVTAPPLPDGSYQAQSLVALAL